MIACPRHKKCSNEPLTLVACCNRGLFLQINKIDNLRFLCYNALVLGEKSSKRNITSWEGFKLRKIVLVVLFISVLCCTAAQAMRIGVWVNDLTHVNRGNAVSIAKMAKRNSIAYLIVRTHKPIDNGVRAKKVHWYRLCPKRTYLKLLHECHLRGVKVYAWMYTYGCDDHKIEVGMAEQAIDAGSDGFVLNAEKECAKQKSYDNSITLCRELRAHIDKRGKKKNCLLAYSTFARAGKGLGAKFPYVGFNRYCDQVWLQSYWRQFDWTPSYTVTKVDAMFQKKYRKWRRQSARDGQVRRRIAWVHTGHAYNGTGTTQYITPKELKEFLETVRNTGHSEANFYTIGYMNPEHFRVLRAFALKQPLKKMRAKNMKRRA